MSFWKKLGDFPADRSPKTSFRLLSLNLFVIPPVPCVSQTRKSARLRWFGSSCLRKYDVLCLQEVFGTLSRRRGRLVKQAQEQGFVDAVVSKRQGFKASDGGIMILSKYPIVHAHSYVFRTSGRSADRLAAKGVLHALIDLQPGNAGGAKLHVFNTHLQASVPGRVDESDVRHVRKEQLREIVSFILGRMKETRRAYPMILAGDFNIDALQHHQHVSVSNAEYLEMQDLLQTQLQCVDLALDLHGAHYSTYGEKEFHRGLNPVANSEPDSEEGTPDSCLDYVFFAKGQGPLRATDCFCQPLYTGDSQSVLGFTQVSDHYGNEVVLTLRPS